MGLQRRHRSSSCTPYWCSVYWRGADVDFVIRLDCLPLTAISSEPHLSPQIAINVNNHIECLIVGYNTTPLCCWLLYCFKRREWSIQAATVLTTPRLICQNSVIELGSAVFIIKIVNIKILGISHFNFIFSLSLLYSLFLSLPPSYLSLRSHLHTAIHPSSATSVRYRWPTWLKLFLR